MTDRPAGRWAALAAFALLVATTQVVWLTYAPVASSVHRDLGVSEGAVGDLAVLFPVVYVLVSIPAGRRLDTAFGRTLALGAALTAVGALVRVVEPASYAWALAGQIVLALGQPLVVNAIAAAAARWFPPPERVVAIAVGSAGQFVGILLAAVTAQPLVDAGGLRALVVAHAVLAVVAAAAVLVALVALRTPATEDATPTRGSTRPDALLWTLAAVLFVGFGVFNALATWLDTLFDHLGSPGRGGLLTAVLTVGGIVGAAVVPVAVARTGRRRAAVTLIGLVTVATLAATAGTGGGVVAGAVLLAVLGFFLLAGLPVALEWAEVHVGAAAAGAATGFLLLAGNLGGAVLVVVVQATLDVPRAAFLVLALLSVPMVVLARRLPADPAQRMGVPPVTATRAPET